MFDLFYFIREGIQSSEVREEQDKQKWQIYLVLQLPRVLQADTRTNCSAWRGTGEGGVGRRG